ncbi:uncharacterized protein LOC123410970 [Hordeum vulgare subsp. vulgare]|uniref:uncharacterized protein LOC123410970 n=1 Tax=Hordeum vulgare subsp. vulgare TaxID=112509 RepID=UPI001D1A4AD8|nr:uncharacterized protein LOC123410970 [Hordeum vulgare subsp. vulgare]
MGKNQAYKAMQRARLGSSSCAPGEGEEDGMTDGSFHSPEWHAARLASLNKTHTLTWEEFKKKQKVCAASVCSLLPLLADFSLFTL